jgi:hypothetical protein
MGGGMRRMGGLRGLGGSSAAPAWTPASLTSLRGEYDARDLTAGSVATWAARTGSLGTFAAITSQPTAVAESIGGAPAVEFDGVSNALRIAAASFGAAVSAYTVAMVAQDITTVTGDRYWNYDGTAPLGLQRPGNIARHMGPASVTSDGLSSMATARLLTFSWTGAEQRIYAGTTLEDFDANANAAPADGLVFALGASNTGSNAANIRVGALYVMLAAITEPELASLKAYVNAIWGV